MFSHMTLTCSTDRSVRIPTSPTRSFLTFSCLFLFFHVEFLTMHEYQNGFDNDQSGFGGKPKFERNNDKFGERKSFGSQNQSFEAREGDWICVGCKNNNFAWRTECKRCNCNKDGTPGTGGGGGRDGDWPCPECNNSNFAWRTECQKCSTANPNPSSAGGRGGFRGGSRGGSRVSLNNPDL